MPFTGRAFGRRLFHSSQAEIQYGQCRTCHGTLEEKPLTRTITNPNDLALRLAFPNPVLYLQIGEPIVVTKQEEPFWNLRADRDGRYELFGKAIEERFVMPLVYGLGCEQKEDEEQSQACHVCHWVARGREYNGGGTEPAWCPITEKTWVVFDSQNPRLSSNLNVWSTVLYHTLVVF